MFRYKFHIVGLNYHDYRGKLDELYTNAVGNFMTLHIDDENVAEKNAIRAYMDSKFVGYVMTGHERDIAESILRINGLTVSAQNDRRGNSPESHAQLHSGLGQQSRRMGRQNRSLLQIRLRQPLARHQRRDRAAADRNH